VEPFAASVSIDAMTNRLAPGSIKVFLFLFRLGKKSSFCQVCNPSARHQAGHLAEIDATFVLSHPLRMESLVQMGNNRIFPLLFSHDIVYL